MARMGLRRVAVAVVALTVWVCLVSAAAVHAFTARDYKDALSKAILFYEGQRSGPLPASQRMKWRGNSALRDGSLAKVDLVGGYYDAGDNVKFGLPMAFTISLLSWAAIENGVQLSAAGELGHTKEAIRWGTDYLLKAHTGPTELYVQVADPNKDHACWQRPEDMETDRTPYKIDASSPGSDVAAETAAALAAASMVFQATDARYAARLRASAKQLFSFADKYRGAYSDGRIKNQVCPFYCSYSGYKDELVWGAAWLYRATRDVQYLQYLERNGAELGGATITARTLSWDDKYAGAQVLAAKFFLAGKQTGLEGYKRQADAFVCGIMPGVGSARYTPGGLFYFLPGSNLQYVTASSFVLTVYAKYLASVRQTVTCGGTVITPAKLYAHAKTQVDYILGNNPQRMSYMVGFGRNYPIRVHHRAASNPSIAQHPARIACGDSFAYYSTPQACPNILTGGIVGGPSDSDTYANDRGNYAQSEPATYINAGMVGLLAQLATAP